MSTTTPQPPARPSAATGTTRWGIVGAAGIARSVVPDMQLVPGIEVVAVHSRSRSSSEALAAECGIPRIHDDLDALLADDGIDAVYIGTPHTLHRAQAEAALRAGKHVVCEKPMTVSAADSQALVDLACERGLLLLEAMWMAFSPGFVGVRDAIAAGEIGEARTIIATFGFVTETGKGRLWDPEVGGGSVLDMGVYPLAFAHGLWGTPSSVAATGRVIDGTVDTDVSMLLGWDDGRQALLTSSLVAALPTGAVVSGTAGRIEVDAPFLASPGLTIVPAGDGERILRTSDIEGRGYVPMFRAAQAAIREGRVECPEMPHSETLALAQLMDEVLAQVGAR